jgi:hypothetical protein
MKLSMNKLRGLFLYCELQGKTLKIKLKSVKIISSIHLASNTCGKQFRVLQHKYSYT